MANPLAVLPSPLTTAAFERLAQTDFPLWFANSVVVTVCVTVGRVFFNSLAGYALARLKFRGRDAVFTAILAVLAVPGIVLLIPKFLVLNYLGIYNTYPALIVPLLVDAAGRVHHEAVLRVDPTLGRGGGPHRRGGDLPHLLVDRPADGAPGRHHLDDPLVPGVVERAGALHHRDQRPAAVHVDPRGRPAHLGRARVGQPVPDLDGRGPAHDHPDRVVFVVFQRYFTQGANAGAEKG